MLYTSVGARVFPSRANKMHLYWKMGVNKSACGQKLAGVEHQANTVMQINPNPNQIKGQVQRMVSQR